MELRKGNRQREMKVIALYLPQFHKVPENEAWWGKDFTDWVSTKNGMPLYPGHYQPHIPLNENYYDLLDKNSMRWQAGLLQEYQVDGLCFYHYWFKDGKQMLEKPAQNLLEWNDINIPFCFCWANTSWARSWAKMKDVDYWINEDEIQVTEDGKALLIEQTYGSKLDWKIHFDYLLPFFKDSRYIRVDNKPVIWIYRMDLVDCLAEMVEYWRILAVENGLEGIYLIGSYYQPENVDVLDAAVIYEPGEILPKVPYSRVEGTGAAIYSYDTYWNKSITRDYADIKTYYTGLVNYDDTPRQGKNGNVISGTPKQFEKWLKRLLKKSEDQGNELVFLNAWNEWGEGNHLEPDEKYEYKYLEAIKSAKQGYKSVKQDEFRVTPLSNEQILEFNFYKRATEKTQTNIDILSVWIKLMNHGISLVKHPVFENISHVAIYGYGIIGKLLKDALDTQNIAVDYFLDKNADKFNRNDEIIPLTDTIPKVDLIIVSLPNYYDEIINQFQKYSISNYILVDEIISELERMYIHD